jgi:3-oxoacyl-[acyl-carrier-protein] synthase II
VRRDVWITGIGLVSSLGEGLDAHWQALAETDAPKPVIDTAPTAPFPIHPLTHLELDKQIPRRSDQRQMEPWQRLGTYAAGLALSDAGIAGNADILTRTHAVIAADGGERDIAADSGILDAMRGAAEPRVLLNQRLGADLRPTLFLAQLPNLLAGNISIVHNVTGSSRTFMGEEIAGVSAVEIAWRRIAGGQGDIFLVGGASLAERKDTTLSYSLGGLLWSGPPTPVWERPERGGGAVMGTIGAFLVLEAPEHAQARGRVPYASLQAVRSEMGRRGSGDVAATLARMVHETAPAGPVNVLSAATGVADPTREEAQVLAGLIGQGRVATVRGVATMMGTALCSTFPAIMGLAALAVSRKGFYRPFDASSLESPPAAANAPVAVTSIGVWRGEGMGLVAGVA